MSLSWLYFFFWIFFSFILLRLLTSSLWCSLLYDRLFKVHVVIFFPVNVGFFIFCQGWVVDFLSLLDYGHQSSPTLWSFSSSDRKVVWFWGTRKEFGNLFVDGHLLTAFQSLKLLKLYSIIRKWRMFLGTMPEVKNHLIIAELAWWSSCYLLGRLSSVLPPERLFCFGVKICDFEFFAKRSLIEISSTSNYLISLSASPSLLDYIFFLRRSSRVFLHYGLN